MDEEKRLKNTIDYVNRVSLKVLNRINLESDVKHNVDNVANAIISDFKNRKDVRKGEIAERLENLKGNYNTAFLNEITKALELIKTGGIDEVKHYDFLYSMVYEKGV